ncbi:MAG: type II toxin-antitoxin system VapC family toxin [Nitrospirae bacterium]|nr:type II toxin-antitoxin system VapC family toxin [Nitrospirota bacterium]
MNYLFDTNILAFLCDENSYFHKEIYQRFSTLKDSDRLYVSVLTLYEMEYSILNGEPDHQTFFRATLKKISDNFHVLPVPAKGAHPYGELKSFLRKTMGVSRENIKKYNIDIILASTAKVEGCVLVSADTIFTVCRELWPDFQFQNWLV